MAIWRRNCKRQAEGDLAFTMIDAERFDFGIPDDCAASPGAYRKGSA